MTSRRALGVNPRYMSICDCCHRTIEAIATDAQPATASRQSHTSLAEVLHCAASCCIVCNAVIKLVVTDAEKKCPIEDRPAPRPHLLQLLNAHPQINEQLALEELLTLHASSPETVLIVGNTTHCVSSLCNESFRYGITSIHDSDLTVTLYPSRQQTRLTVHKAQDPGDVDSTLQSGDMEAISLCRFWLHVCRTSHEMCRSARSEWQPSRLLHLRNGIATLVEASETQIDEGYATLSHCWGSSQHMVLTSTNVIELKAGLPISSFPHTFCDAMQVVISLGINYIWIDSFCILQQGPGSFEDWERESQLMHKVYAHGVFNIGATSASCSLDGLNIAKPIDRLPYALVTMRFRSKKPQPAQYEVWPHSQLVDHEIAGPQGPLLTRGWVVQEQVLSNRMIHFARNGLWWQCQHVTWSDMTPFHVPVVSLSHPALFLGGDALSMSCLEALPMWLDVVRMYSATALTYPDVDKLRAVDGIMQLLKNVSGEVFFLGHPVSCMLPSLLWAAINETTPRPGREMPSWSWAAVEGQVEFPQTTNHWHKQTLAVLIARSSSTTMTVLGRLLVAHAARGGRLRSGDLMERCTWWPLRLQAVSTCVPRAVFDSHAKHKQLVEQAKPVFLLPLLHRTCVQEHASLLVLEMKEDGSYQRLGVAGFGHYVDGRSEYAAFEQACARTNPSLITLS